MKNKKKKPLYIEFIVDPDKGVYFSWNLDRENIHDYIPIWTFPKNKELVLNLLSSGKFIEGVNEKIQKFFDCDSHDIKIPPNCPYELYKKGMDEPCFEGYLKKRG